MPTSLHDRSSGSAQPPYSASQIRSAGDPAMNLPGQRAMQGGTGRRCPTCDAPTSANQSVCPQCGARLQRRREVIRCRHCGQRASSQLVLCPGCGRELQAASSRLLTVALPALVVLLMIVVLGVQRGPLGWLQRQMDGGLQVINNIAITPVHTEDVALTQETSNSDGALIALRPLALPAPTEDAALLPSETTEEAIDETGAEDAEVNETLPSGEPDVVRIGGEAATPVAESEPAEAAPVVSEEPTATPPPTETAIPTETPTSTETPLPTQTPAPTNTIAATPSPTLRVVAANPTPTRTAAATAIPTATASPAATASPSVTQTVAAITTSARIDLRATVESIRSTAALTPTNTPTVAGTSTSTPIPPTTYTVKTGDTLVGIAQRFEIPMQTLLDANDLTAESAADLQIGRVLVLPGVSSVVDERTQSYIVRAGDTLVGIALRFNVSTEALLRVNGLVANDARTLQVGQEILIPTTNTSSNTVQIQPMPTAVRPTSTPIPAPIEYTIRTGDTVVGIAARFGTTAQALLAFNNLTEAQARRLRPGDVLLIPR